MKQIRLTQLRVFEAAEARDVHLDLEKGGDVDGNAGSDQVQSEIEDVQLE